MASETWTNIRKKMKKIFRLLTFLIILILAGFIYWKFFFTYSEGYRAGLLQKFSHKGNIFKTYEGEIVLSSVKSSNNVALASEKFYFSVLDEKIATRLDTIQGQFVIVHYTERNGKLFWRGESKYFVDEVKLKD
jgi:hypothetical protein